MTLLRVIPYLIILILVICMVWRCESPEPLDTSQYLMYKIDSLSSEVVKLQAQNDSLFSKIDSSSKEIEIVEKWYEKEFVDITNQPVADDVLFFTNYISEIGK